MAWKVLSPAWWGAILLSCSCTTESPVTRVTRSTGEGNPELFEVQRTRHQVAGGSSDCKLISHFIKTNFRVVYDTKWDPHYLPSWLQYGSFLWDTLSFCAFSNFVHVWWKMDRAQNGKFYCMPAILLNKYVSTFCTSTHLHSAKNVVGRVKPIEIQLRI